MPRARAYEPHALALGIRRLKPRGRLGFNQYDQVIFAALAGHGLALGRWLATTTVAGRAWIEALVVLPLSMMTRL